MRAIILVGGFGTRLGTVLRGLPKPMAPIENKPFLAYLLDYLKSQGITEVMFSVHYGRDTIQNYFQASYEGIVIEYAIEKTPLGTGGAIQHALTLFPSDQPIFVLNGDTFIRLDYQAVYNEHKLYRSPFTIVLQSVLDCSRYGKVVVDKDTIISFQEKGENGSGLINAGVYLIDPLLFLPFSMPQQFSFESDFVYAYLAKLAPRYFINHDYFIDIGVPEDYARAQVELPIYVS